MKGSEIVLTFLRAYENGTAPTTTTTVVNAPRLSRLRRVIAAVAFVSLAVYSFGIFSPTAASARPSRSRKAMVRAETVRLRTAPGKHGKMSALLDAGRIAKVVDKQDGWVKLKLATGTEGWVRADLVTVNRKRSKDKGSFAPKHHDDEDAPRSARRTHKKSEAVVAKVSTHKKTAKKTAAPKAKPVMHPIHVAKAKPAPKPKPAVRMVAKAKPAARVIKHIAAAPTPKPIAVEAVLTPVSTANVTTVETERPLATVTTAEPESIEVGDTIEVAAPKETVAVETAPVIIETVAPVVQPVAKKRTLKKGAGLAPAVTVPIIRASKRGDKIVRRALSYRGVPYRMGATGRGAFDCSGFTRYVLNQSGEALPRTAAEQYNRGISISKSELRSGDLVFFKNTYKHGVSHVGIYMGNGKFVHASSRGGVRTNMLSESYYVHHWAGARRPRVTQGSDE